MEINVTNLNQMADYLDSGDLHHNFNMRAYCDCVVGHALRVLDRKTGNWNFQWVAQATARIFGIDDRSSHVDPTWQFCFGANWPSDPHLAAVRLRYVARHGAAPDASQWKRFEFEQSPAPPDDIPELAELACA